MSRAAARPLAERRTHHRRKSIQAHAGSVFRFYIGGNAIVSWYVAMTDPRSLLHLIASTPEGMVLAWAVMLIGAWALADAIINDVLPCRFRWPLALAQRHFILVGMAFGYVAQLYIAVSTARPASLLVYYVWHTSVIMAVAFIDATQRSKDQACKITAS
ncbi:hypothetical protein [Duganella aceris]|uniref:MFS transporter n=1 Tax=Duganella aceris TaxID=2703883 RepID=A0ABX0FP57_9BURK|nr:hypothetical protein [Duganella aceris]NGZ86403.1 hypothetical protein [Duganella aceris]